MRSKWVERSKSFFGQTERTPVFLALLINSLFTTIDWVLSSILYII